MEDKPQSPFAAIYLAVVFILAIAVFAGVAFGCKWLLLRYIVNENLCAVLSFAAAAAGTLGVLYVVKAVNRRQMKNK